MKHLLLLLILIPVLVFGQDNNNIDRTVQDKFYTAEFPPVHTIQDLTKHIAQLTTNKKEQLQMLLLWTHENMYADSSRFFQAGNPLTTEASLQMRTGLCDEFSNIFSD